jgi:hypothetical protein
MPVNQGFLRAWLALSQNWEGHGKATSPDNPERSPSRSALIGADVGEARGLSSARRPGVCRPPPALAERPPFATSPFYRAAHFALLRSGGLFWRSLQL